VLLQLARRLGGGLGRNLRDPGAGAQHGAKTVVEITAVDVQQVGGVANAKGLIEGIDIALERLLTLVDQLGHDRLVARGRGGDDLDYDIEVLAGTLSDIVRRAGRLVRRRAELVRGAVQSTLGLLNAGLDDVPGLIGAGFDRALRHFSPLACSLLGLLDAGLDGTLGSLGTLADDVGVGASASLSGFDSSFSRAIGLFLGLIGSHGLSLRFFHERSGSPRVVVMSMFVCGAAYQAAQA
jgi:hypothetical protein